MKDLNHPSEPARRWSDVVATLAMVMVMTCPMLQATAVAQEPNRILWRFQIDSTFPGEFTAVGNDGTIYATDANDLYALAPDGTLLWTAAGAGGRRPITIGDDGTIYTGAFGVVAVNPDGSERWRFVPPGQRELVAGPAIGPDGRIYGVQNTLGGGIGVFALDGDGNLEWSDPGDPAVSTAQGGNSTIQFGQAIDRIYFGAPTDPQAPPEVWAFDSDGDQLWTLGQGCQSLPFVDAQDRIVVARSGACGVSTYGPDGQLVWNAPPPGNGANIMVLPTIGPDGVVYTGPWFGDHVWAIEPDGSTKWYVSGVGTMNKMGVTPDNTVLVDGGPGSFASGSQVRGFSTVDGSILWEVDLPDEDGSSPLVASRPVFSPDGETAYLVTSFPGDTGLGYLYAIDATPATTASVLDTAPTASSLQLVARPTPFHRSTEIRFETARAGRAHVRVFDVAGHLVRTLLDAEVGAGAHRVQWDGVGANGRSLAAGVYVVQVEAESSSVTRKVILH